MTQFRYDTTDGTVWALEVDAPHRLMTAEQVAAIAGGAS